MMWWWWWYSFYILKLGAIPMKTIHIDEKFEPCNKEEAEISVTTVKDPRDGEPIRVYTIPKRGGDSHG